MRIAQTIIEGASELERKSQRIDFVGLSDSHEVVLVPSASLAGVSADLIHVYGPELLPAAPFIGLTIPFVASGRVARRRLAIRQPPQPRALVSPIDSLPEAVEELWFSAADSNGDRPGEVRRVASFGPHRAGVKNQIEQTLARLHRFRDDIEWLTLDRAPAPEDLIGVDVWVDPATSVNDYDGFVAEAIVAGKPVVAARTPINTQRLEKGRTGFLVPVRDPNELAHAILSALFKPEVARPKIEAARQTAGKFRPRQRLRVLERLYQTLIP
ncbi:MAG: glycosyltransferase [Thermoanaerobaculia bacterium]|nr:glycosyltransferase [Thermoanaerobaculia bacterium]